MTVGIGEIMRAKQSDRPHWATSRAPYFGLRSAGTAAILTLCAVVAGCSSTGSGGVLGLVSSDAQANAAAQQAPAAQTPATDPLARPIHVAQTVARAQRCGFYFEPETVKTSYLAHAATQTTSPEDLKRVELVYRMTHAKLSKDLKATKDYCSEPILKEIREDLPPYVAGNFDGPLRVAKKPKGSQPWIFRPRGAGPEKFDRERIFAPTDKKF